MGQATAQPAGLGAPTASAPLPPPGPRLPSAVQTAAFVRDPLAFWRRCGTRYGRCFAVTIWPFGRMVVITDRELVKTVLTGDRDDLRAGEGNATGGLFEAALGRGSLLLLDGADHLRHRRLMLPPFHGRRLHAYAERMAEAARRSAAGWPRGEAFTLRPRLQDITLEVILSTVFGVEDPTRVERFRELAVEFVDMSGRRGVMLPPLRRLGRLNRPLRRFVSARAGLHGLLAEEIAERRAAEGTGGRDDVLSLLVAARFEDGGRLSDAELRDELMTLLMAGHETTASAISWTVELLLRHPAEMARLRSELGSDGDAYLDAVIEESLRLRPVIDLVARRARAPVTLGPYAVRAGELLAPSIYLLHLDPEYYPEPQLFRPERFLGRSPDTYAWLPFGGGARRCLGASFAQFEMRIVLREILQHVLLRPARREPERVAMRNITLAPARGVEVVAESRS